jgi:hypothetical protein
MNISMRNVALLGAWVLFGTACDQMTGSTPLFRIDPLEAQTPQVLNQAKIWGQRIRARLHSLESPVRAAGESLEDVESLLTKVLNQKEGPEKAELPIRDLFDFLSLILRDSKDEGKVEVPSGQMRFEGKVPGNAIQASTAPECELEYRWTQGGTAGDQKDRVSFEADADRLLNRDAGSLGKCTVFLEAAESVLSCTDVAGSYQNTSQINPELQFIQVNNLGKSSESISVEGMLRDTASRSMAFNGFKVSGEKDWNVVQNQ